MNRFESIDESSINRVRINPKQTNDVGNASSIVGLWILLPLAISGFVFVGVHIIMLILFGNSETINWNQVFIVTWSVLSILCQSIYWMRITKSLGLTSVAGLWSLVPIAGWFKTFRFAFLAAGKNRDYLSDMPSAVSKSYAARPESTAGIRADNRRKSIEVFSGIRKFRAMPKKSVIEGLISPLEFIGKFKKPILVILVFALASFVAPPRIYDYRAKNSALKLISAFQEMEKSSVIRPLDYEPYREKIDPLIDNFLRSTDVPNVFKSTTCNSLQAKQMTKTLMTITSYGIGIVYPENVIGQLTMYVKTCN